MSISLDTHRISQSRWVLVLTTTEFHSLDQSRSRHKQNFKVLGGSKKLKTWFLNLRASYSCSPTSTDSKNKKMSSEDHSEVLPLEWPFLDKNMAKIQRNWPQFETLFSLVIYIFSTLCRLTRKDHHVAILWLYLDGHYGYFVKIDHNGPK